MSHREPLEPESTSQHPGGRDDPGPARPAKRVLPKMGKSGVGASGAMAQISQDRLIAGAMAWTAEDQIREIWRARPVSQRNLAGLRELQVWLARNAPELLPESSESQAYLLRLLGGELVDTVSARPPFQAI